MKYFKIFLFAILLVSCVEVSEQTNSKPIPNAPEGFRTFTIDSCEYILRELGVPNTSGYSFAFTHKGNCKHCLNKK